MDNKNIQVCLQTRCNDPDFSLLKVSFSINFSISLHRIWKVKLLLDSNLCLSLTVKNRLISPLIHHRSTLQTLPSCFISKGLKHSQILNLIHSKGGHKLILIKPQQDELSNGDSCWRIGLSHGHPISSGLQINQPKMRNEQFFYSKINARKLIPSPAPGLWFCRTIKGWEMFAKQRENGFY